MLAPMGLIRARIVRLALLGTWGGIAACDSGTESTPATALRFADLPADLVAGQTFSLTVELTGSDGVLATESGRPVTLDVSDGGQLTGPVTITADAGAARFTDLAITTAGDAVRLVTTAGSLTATSASFKVRPASPSGTRSSFLPDSIVFIPGVAAPLEFVFTDAFGNPIANQAVSITSSLSGTSLNPPSGVTGDDGVFTTSIVATTSGTSTLSATIGGSSLTLGGHLAATEFCAPPTLNIPGSISGAIPVATCDAVGRPAAVYRFTKSGGGGVRFNTVPAGFTARVEVKTSLVDQNVAIQPMVAIPAAEWLLPDGTYLYRISSLSLTGSGSFSVTSTAIAANTGTTARFIVTPGTYTGQSLALSDREFGDGTMYDYFILYSDRPCTITLRSTAFDASLWIDDAVEQVTIDNDENGGGGTDARISRSACNTNGNPIGILANSFPSSNGTTPVGAYTLTIEYGSAAPALRSRAGEPPVVHPDTARRDLSEMIRRRAMGTRR